MTVDSGSHANGTPEVLQAGETSASCDREEVRRGDRRESEERGETAHLSSMLWISSSNRNGFCNVT